MALSGKVKPVSAAKELGIKPQLVYGWIKGSKIKVYPGDAHCKQYVDMTEVRGMANAAARKPDRGTKGTKPRTIKTKSVSTGKWEDSGYPSPLEHAQVVSYGKKKGKVIAQVRSQDEYFTNFVQIDPEQKERELVFQNTTIADLLKKGNFKLEPLDDVLNYILFQLGHEADPHEVRDFLEFMVKYEHVVNVELNPGLVEDIESLDDLSDVDEPFEVEEREVPWLAQGQPLRKVRLDEVIGVDHGITHLV